MDANYNFGCPRIGNSNWASFYNSLVGDASVDDPGLLADLKAQSAAIRRSSIVGVPRWSATLRSSVAAALEHEAEGAAGPASANISSLRAFLQLTEEGGPVDVAQLETAEDALARLSYAMINRNAANIRRSPARMPAPVNFRLVHHDDIVPHLPPEDVGFNHEIEGADNRVWLQLLLHTATAYPSTEVWLSENQTAWTECSIETGEDHSCSWSVPILDYSIADHLDYFGVELNC